MASPRVVVIGLDGMTPYLVEPWMREGKLPNLARIAQEGAYGRLLSTIPPSSPQAWSSFLTGKNPGKHGVFGFAHRKQDSYEWTLTTSRDRIGPDLGQMISHWGKRAGFLFVPLTYPPYQTNGFMVSGIGTPGPNTTFACPYESKDELLREFGLESLFEPPIVDQDPLEYLAELENFVENNYRVFEWLQSRFSDLEFYMVVFTAPDRIQHVAWHFMDPTSPKYPDEAAPELRHAVLRIYQKVDTVVGRIASTLPPDTTLIVMSDHGAGPYKKFVDLNAWLAQEGLLSFAENATQSSNRIFFAQVYRLWRSGPRRLFSAWQRRRLKGWLPKRWRTRIDVEWRNPLVKHVDWSCTQAFSEGTEGLITLNLRGREPQGIVEPEKRADLLRKIETGLHQLKNPETGEPVVNRVWRREEIYHGDATERAPDLMVEWFKEQYESRAIWNPQRVIFLDPDKWKSTRMILSGHHRREGVIFAKGPFVAPETSIQGAEIVDLAPTILALMGLPLLPEFDGKVLKELTVGIEDIRIEEPEKANLSAGDSEVYSEEETKQVEELLRGLGYIE